MVSVSVNGRSELLSIRIDREVIKPEEQGMLEDLVLSAVNEGLRKSQEMARKEMGKFTGGMNIPGLF
jgi:DNA-binding YbaB/EbfC family protein